MIYTLMPAHLVIMTVAIAHHTYTDSEDQGALHDVCWKTADKFLLADVSKLAEAVAVDPLDEVIRYDDENAQSWGHDGVDDYDPAEDLERVDKAIQQRCELTRSVVQRLTKHMSEMLGGGGKSEASQVNDGQTAPPDLAANLAEGNRKLQAQVQLFKDRLVMVSSSRLAAYMVHDYG